MRVRALLALVPVGVLLAAPWSGPPAAGSCAGPSLDTVPSLDPGAATTISGRRFDDRACDDTGTTGGGCEDEVEDEDEDEEAPTPFADVTLTLVQGDLRWDLGTADADPDGAIAWTVTIPADAVAGRARLETPYGATRVRID